MIAAPSNLRQSWSISGQRAVWRGVHSRRAAARLTQSVERPPKIFVSYAWGDDLTPEGWEREVLVDRLCEDAAARGVTILRDRSALRTGDSIDAFMRQIGAGDRIFIFLSDKYLRSPFCMFELSEIWRNSRREDQTFLDRVRLYPLPDAAYRTTDDWISWAVYWENRYEEMVIQVKDNIRRGIEPVFRRMERMRSFYQEVTPILALLADRVSARDFDDFKRYGFDEPYSAPWCPIPLTAPTRPADVRRGVGLAKPVPRPADPDPWPPWASDRGDDGFGRFARFTVEGATQTMRWIPPGAFMMGSPDDEPGRWADEGPRRPVTLSAGFWLFDTPCTQALWSAVMGYNPSRFQTPDRPVENVSWKDAKSFIDRINGRIPDLGLTLPTEAQWEYACRAGTQTATYAGPAPILGKNNAPALDPIAWYGGNSGVDFDLLDGLDSSKWPMKQYPHRNAGTHPVALKEPNPWGLYDMLGNVWEWCEDGMRTYGKTQALDPVGPTRNDAWRILRGGSSFNFARLCRSACRGKADPGPRGLSISTGFRCARVQGGAA
jgi:formylglycine-generating enzyme required for sulfatase activity